MIDWIQDNGPVIVIFASSAVFIAFVVWLALSVQERDDEEARLVECEAILRCLDAGATREQCDEMHPECAP